MGSILQGVCPCGFRSSDVFAGGGMTPGDHNLPGLCAHCENVVTVDMSKPRLRCTRCGRKPTILDPFPSEDPLDESIGGELLFECPRCHERSMSFEFVGIWD